MRISIMINNLIKCFPRDFPTLCVISSLISMTTDEVEKGCPPSSKLTKELKEIALIVGRKIDSLAPDYQRK